MDGAFGSTRSPTYCYSVGGDRASTPLRSWLVTRRLAVTRLLPRPRPGLLDRMYSTLFDVADLQSGPSRVIMAGLPL
jgi:hypothetical protein